MSGLRAQWHLASALEAQEDPFADVLHSRGIHIDLKTATEDELTDVLGELLRREGNLYSAGITCELKEKPGNNCRTCLCSQTGAESAKAALCRLGKDQVLIEVAAREKVALRQAPVIELAEVAEGASEVGHLSAEYDELLTTHGL